MKRRTLAMIAALALACALLASGCQQQGANPDGSGGASGKQNPAASQEAAAGDAASAEDDEVLEGVLSEFEKIAAIPRPSGHEERIGDYLMQWARDHGLDPRQDEVGNVIFDAPATQGHEDFPLVVLQGHMDMVAVSDDPSFDPENTPITPVRDGDLLTADGTSLGADDGAGLAIMLHYVASNAQHGPLRIIVTVNEEDTSIGAISLDPAELQDAKYLINIDSEKAGEATVSAAGGAGVTMSQKPRRVAPTLDTALSLEMSGLSGGHSAIAIDKGRINAIQETANLLAFLDDEGIVYELASLSGGDALNAIPTDCQALIVVAAGDAERVRELAAQHAEGLAKAYAASDPDVQVSVEDAELPASVFEAKQRGDIVDLASLYPDGLFALSQEMEGLVESSSNLGVLHADETAVEAESFARSTKEELLETVGMRQARLAERCGFAADITSNNPPWPVDTSSTLLPIMQEAYRETAGEELAAVSTHGWLECASFAGKAPELDMVAIGPTIDNPHSTDETLHLDTIVPVYRMLELTLSRLQ